jgi:hypothetical protein
MSAADAMSPEDAREAMELRAFTNAYERALTQVMMSGEFNITDAMMRDMSHIIVSNPNPLIKVELLMNRLKHTEFGKRVMILAILGNDHGLAERMRNADREAQAQAQKQLEDKIRLRTAELEKAAAEAAAIEADRIVNAQMREGVPYGTFTEFGPSHALPFDHEPLTFQIKPPKKTGNMGGKKSHKKSHKKGGKKSHKKRTHRRRH